MRMTDEIRNEILRLREDHSVPEIVRKTGISKSHIWRVLKNSEYVHTSSDSESIRSRVRKQYVRDDRRRALFGLDQKTNLKVFSNKDRITLRYCLKRKGYIFMGRGANTAYYNSDTVRDNVYEEKGVKLGLRFQAMVM